MTLSSLLDVLCFLAGEQIGHASLATQLREMVEVHPEPTAAASSPVGPRPGDDDPWAWVRNHPVLTGSRAQALQDALDGVE